MDFGYDENGRYGYLESSTSFDVGCYTGGMYLPEISFSSRFVVVQQTNGGCWWCTDKQGEFFFDHWQNGKGKELFLDDEEWGNYMRADQHLFDLIGYEIDKRHPDGSSGTVIGRMHGQTGKNNYWSGYGMLHGSNSRVGDLEYFGSANLNQDGSTTFNLTLTFHDIMDPKYEYGDDKFFAKQFPGTKYNVHITWSLSLTLYPPETP